MEVLNEQLKECPVEDNDRYLALQSRVDELGLSMMEESANMPLTRLALLGSKEGMHSCGREVSKSA